MSDEEEDYLPPLIIYVIEDTVIAYPIRPEVHGHYVVPGARSLGYDTNGLLYSLLDVPR